MIYVGEGLRLRHRDFYNYVIEEYRMVCPRGEEAHMAWVTLGYYGTVQGAMAGILKKLNDDSFDAVCDIKELIARIDANREMVLESCKDIIVPQYPTELLGGETEGL